MSIRPIAAALKAITGWAPGTKAVSDSYGNPGNPDLHVTWVQKIEHDLYLSFLYGAGAKLTLPVAKRRLNSLERRGGTSSTPFLKANRHASGKRSAASLKRPVPSEERTEERDQ